MDRGGIGRLCRGVARCGVSRGIQGSWGITWPTRSGGIPSTGRVSWGRGIHCTRGIHRRVRGVWGVGGGRSCISRGIVWCGAWSGIPWGIMRVGWGVTRGVPGSEPWGLLWVRRGCQ